MAALGDIVTTPERAGTWVVAGFMPAPVTSWRIIRRSPLRSDALEGASELDSRLIVLASPTFTIGQTVRVPFEGTGVVVADRGDTVRVRISHRFPTAAGDFIGKTGMTDFDRGAIVAENLAIFGVLR